MKVSSIQMNMAFSSPDENYRRAEELIRKTVEENRPDTVVLPETWNLGFFPRENLLALSDKEGERTKSLLSSLSKEHKELKNMVDDMVDLIGCFSDEMKADIILVAMLICAVDGKISLKEKNWIKKLIK